MGELGRDLGDAARGGKGVAGSPQESFSFRERIDGMKIRLRANRLAVVATCD